MKPIVATASSQEHLSVHSNRMKAKQRRAVSPGISSLFVVEWRICPSGLPLVMLGFKSLSDGALLLADTSLSDLLETTNDVARGSAHSSEDLLSSSALLSNGAVLLADVSVSDPFSETTDDTESLSDPSEMTSDVAQCFALVNEADAVSAS